MTIGLTTFELASAALVEGTIWTLGTVMSKIAFCTIEHQWKSGQKHALHLLCGILHLIVMFVSGYPFGSRTTHFY